MGVFQVFKIVQKVPNRAKHHICKNHQSVQVNSHMLKEVISSSRLVDHANALQNLFKLKENNPSQEIYNSKLSLAVFLE